MKTINLIFVSLAFINCYGSKDSGVNTTPAAAPNAQLKFDGKSYTLTYGEKEITDAKLSFTQQEEVNPMELESLPADHATELSKSDYFPRFLVTAESQGLSCKSSSVAFSESMDLVCQESPEAATTGGSTPAANQTEACVSGNSPANINGANYTIDATDGELLVTLAAMPVSDTGGNLNNKTIKFKDASGVFGGGFVVGGMKVTGTLDAEKTNNNDYEVFFETSNPPGTYEIGSFSKVRDVVSGTGSSTVYRVNLSSNVCVAKFKTSSGLLSNGAGYLVLSN